MPEPVIHEVQRGLLEEEMAKYHDAWARKEPEGRNTRPGEPLKAFAFDLDPVQLKTDMALWKTFTQADRLRRARLMVQFPDTVTGTRDLMYVVWSEAQAGGSREVAAVAFNGLFPEKQAPKKGK